MSNIENLRQLHHTKVKFEKDSIPRKGVLFLRKGPRFSVKNAQRTWSSYSTFTKRAWTL